MLVDFYEGGGRPEHHADLEAFVGELLAQFPALESLGDDDAEWSSPWASTPTVNDGVVEINITWGSPGEDALEPTVELARRHNLVLYDPQGPDVHSPRGIPRQRSRWPWPFRR